MKVWVVVADCGLNGSWALAALQHEPTKDEVKEFEDKPPDPEVPWIYPRRVTGFSGIEVVEMEVQP